MTTMDERYGDESNHTVCDKCGFCVDCDDCKNFGCGDVENPINPIIQEIDSFRLKKEQKDEWVLHHGDVVINSKIWREIKRKWVKEWKKL